MIVDILHLNNSNKNSLEILISYFLIRREDLSKTMILVKCTLLAKNIVESKCFMKLYVKLI